MVIRSSSTLVVSWKGYHNDGKGATRSRETAARWGMRGKGI